MSYEDFWPQVNPTPITAASATNTSVISVTTTIGFYAYQSVNITSSYGSGQYEVREVLGPTQLRIGNISSQNAMPGYQATGFVSSPNLNMGGHNGNGADMSIVTGGTGALISAPHQLKNRTNAVNALAVAYMNEPIVAHRYIQVDSLGGLTGTAAVPAAWQFSSLTASQVTGNSAAAATQVMSLSKNAKLLQISSNFNSDCGLTINGVQAYRLSITATPYQFNISLGANGMFSNVSTTIGLFFNNSTTPTSGIFNLTAIG